MTTVTLLREKEDEDVRIKWKFWNFGLEIETHTERESGRDSEEYNLISRANAIVHTLFKRQTVGWNERKSDRTGKNAKFYIRIVEVKRETKSKFEYMHVSTGWRRRMLFSGDVVTKCGCTSSSCHIALSLIVRSVSVNCTNTQLTGHLSLSRCSSTS